MEALEGSNSPAVQRVEIQGAVVRAASCGHTHCVAVAGGGAIFTWGSGRDWALGCAWPCDPYAHPHPPSITRGRSKATREKRLLVRGHPRFPYPRTRGGGDD